MDHTNDDRKRRILDAFLVDNNELEELDARLAGFNLFRVLRIEKTEIRHSNVLAWLLTPNAAHGLGDLFLRRFLSRLLMANQQISTSLTPARVELMDLSDVEVLREWRNIDILAHSASGGWCLLIENKIASKESAGQLAKYKSIVEQEFASAELVPVFLTMDGEDPSDDGQEAGYVSLSHVEVLELAERMVGQNRSRIPGDAQTFLNHYLDVLRRLSMQDEGLVELCKTIYRKHREAIDLIVEYGTSSQVLEACETQITDLVPSEFVTKWSNRVWFIPNEMVAHQAEVLTGWKALPRRLPIVCWFFHGRKRGMLQAVMEVGPIAESETRIRLMHALKNAGFQFGEAGAFRNEAKFTRIVSKIQKLRKNEDGDPDEDTEYIQQVTKTLWEKLWADGHKITRVLAEFDWDARKEKKTDGTSGFS